MNREKKGSADKKENAIGLHRLFDTEVDIRIRVLTIVALAGAVGNTLGFLANLMLYGLNFVTLCCFVCAVLIICNLLFGLRSRHCIPLGYAMLLLLNVFEFPLLTLTYGAVMCPYMMIGFHALAMISNKQRRISLCTLLGVYDIIIIVYSYLYPYIFGPQDAMGLLGSAVITFAISIFTVAGLVIMWQNVYLLETIEIDSVTKVQSRVGFNKNAEKILKNDSSGNYSMLYFNVVSFKVINSVFGIDGGNRFLAAAAAHLSTAPFTPRLVGRLDADHFVCLVNRDHFDSACLETVCQVPFEERGRRIQARMLCGIYDISDRSLPISAMYDRACAALRLIHNSVSRFYAVYDGKAEAGYRDETMVLSEIGNAIQNGQFLPYYQPIVDCATGKIVSAEALARWEHPEMGLISPSVFIPVLEKKNQISQLDGIIAKSVHAFLESRLAEGKSIVPISVNLSRWDLYDHGLMNELYSMVQGMGSRGALHRFEITESAYEDLSDYTLQTISNLRKCGASVLVDDFGSGYSSLGMITDYEFDLIKLDVQFVKKIVGNDKIRGVVQSLIDMAHKLGAKVVTEGVETEAQYQAIRECGSDYIQGYHFHKPLRADEFLALLDGEYAKDAAVL